MGGLFSKKKFFMRANLFGQTYGGLFYMKGLMIALCKGRESFANTTSSNLNTINPKVFPMHGGIGFILEVNG